MGIGIKGAGLATGCMVMEKNTGLMAQTMRDSSLTVKRMVTVDSKWPMEMYMKENLKIIACMD